jgi:hypothetical protein
MTLEEKARQKVREMSQEQNKQKEKHHTKELIDDVSLRLIVMRESEGPAGISNGVTNDKKPTAPFSRKPCVFVFAFGFRVTAPLKEDVRNQLLIGKKNFKKKEGS